LPLLLQCLFHLSDKAVELTGFADIQRQRHGAPPHRRNFLYDRLRLIGMAAVRQNDIGASGSQF